MLNRFHQYYQEKTTIPIETITLLLEDVKIKKVEKGTVLLKQGDVCHFTFFVLKGLLRSYTIDKLGKEHLIQFAPEDWWIGDRSSFYFNEPSDLYIDVVEDSEIVFLDQPFFDKAASLSPEFTAYNTFALHNNIRHMQRRVNLLLGATAEERYLDFIHLYFDVTLRVPQWMIASYLGVTPESLSRVRKELARKNFKPY